jgi:hypothetical protein
LDILEYSSRNPVKDRTACALYVQVHRTVRLKVQDRYSSTCPFTSKLRIVTFLKEKTAQLIQARDRPQVSEAGSFGILSSCFAVGRGMLLMLKLELMM